MLLHYAEYKLPFNFTFKANFAVDKKDQISGAFIPQINGVDMTGRRSASLNNINFVFDASRNSPVARRASYNEFDVTLYTTLNYDNTFGDHALSGVLGFSRETFDYQNFRFSVTDFPVNDLTDVDVFGAINERELGKGFSGVTTSNRLLSYFGRVSYDYQKKYLLDATVRYDGSSKFAEENRFGLFPSFSAAWRIDNEDFLKNLNLFDQLKLRLSWGQLGNQNIGNNMYLPIVRLKEDYTLGNEAALGAAVVAAYDPEIHWETLTISNIGLESWVLDSKLGLTFDYFIKTTEGILGEVRVPSQVGGLLGPTRNFGTVENKGYELGLTFRDNAGDFRYDVFASIMQVDNKITALEPGVTERISGNFINRVGFPINSYYIIESDGIIRNQSELDNAVAVNQFHGIGDLNYVDANDDGVIDADDRKIFSNGVYPNFTYTFNTGFGYKGFDLTLFFQGTQGNSMLFHHNQARPFYNGAGVSQDWVDNAFSEQNPDSEYPRLFTTFGSSPNKLVSSFWLKDASYLRLKNAQLSYALPAKSVQKIGIRRLKVFVNATNLFTIDKLPGFDPERDYFRSTSGYNYPTVRTYTAGINVTF